MTIISDDAANLLDGQRSRICLARAVYADAHITLLDEVLSAVDPVTAQHVMEQCLFGLMANKTRVLVACADSKWLHRADLIVHIETGACVFCGSYSDFKSSAFASEELQATDDSENSEAVSVQSGAGAKGSLVCPALPWERLKVAESYVSERETALKSLKSVNWALENEDHKAAKVSTETWQLYFGLMWHYRKYVFMLVPFCAMTAVCAQLQPI